MSTVVFLHGFLGCSLDWGMFSDMGISVGYSGVSYEECHEQVFRQVSGLGKIVLVGYSLGARVAVSFALRYPGLVEGLVLESYSPGIVSRSQRLQRGRLDREWGRRFRRDYRMALYRWYQLPLFESLSSREGFDLLIRDRLHRDPDLMAAMIEGLSPGRVAHQWDMVQQLHCPISLITGELDTKYQAIAEKLVSLRTDIQHFTVANAGHNTHFEEPEQYRQILRSILL